MENPKSYFYILMAIIYVAYQIYEQTKKKQAKKVEAPQPILKKQKQQSAKPIQEKVNQIKQEKPYQSFEGNSLEKPIEEINTMRAALQKPAEEILIEEPEESLNFQFDDKQSIRQAFVMSEIFNNPKWSSKN